VRDPTATNLEVEAAIEEACKDLGYAKRHGWLTKKLPFDNQLRHEALNLIERLPDEDMPPHLRDYICGVLSKEKGLRRTYAAGRDQAIIEVLYSIAKWRGFSPTRNRSRKTVSACFIVAAALARIGVHMNERSIEDIWSRAVRDDETLKLERPAKTAL
jgi:hypothetical protein